MLKLDEIQDEILDECFSNEHKTIDSLDGDVDDSDDENTIGTDNVVLPTDKIKSKNKKVQYISNEDLVRNIQNNIDVEHSKERIIMFNSGLVYNEAKNCTCNIPFQDKVQYGFEGLMKAIYGFNLNFKTRFSTYATAAIRQHMYRNGNNEVRIVALPEHLSMLNIRIQRFIEATIQECTGYPTHEQIAAGTGIDIRSVKRVMNYNSNTFSFDTPLSRDGDEGTQQTLKDVIPGDNDDYIVDERCLNNNFLNSIEDIMDELDEHERVLLGLIHGLDGYRIHTFDEIISTGYIDVTNKYVVSKATLSRRYSAVINKVRKVIKRKKISFDY